MQVNRTLTSVNMSDNDYTDDGARAMVECFKVAVMMRSGRVMSVQANRTLTDFFIYACPEDRLRMLNCLQARALLEAAHELLN